MGKNDNFPERFNPKDSKTNLIELKDIYFGYENREILKELDLAVPKGSKLGITGPNGVGKTTMVEIIMGFITPSSGSIYFKGKKVHSEEDFYNVRKSIGYVFQDPDDQLFSPTVAEDIAFGLLNIGVERNKVDSIIDATLKNLGILHLKERITYRLSGGEKKLVSIATVLAMKPEAIILDEPINGLDEENRQRITLLLKRLDSTLLVISHSMSFLKEVATDIFLLKEGKLHHL